MAAERRRLPRLGSALTSIKFQEQVCNQEAKRLLEKVLSTQVFKVVEN